MKGSRSRIMRRAFEHLPAEARRKVVETWGDPRPIRRG
jgi:hypothetical protein